MTAPRTHRLGLGWLAALTLAALLAPAAAQAEFGIAPSSFLAKTHATVPLAQAVNPFPVYQREVDIGAIAAAPSLIQAGAHPDATASFRLVESTPGASDDNAKDVEVALPAGFVGDPEAVPACTRADFSGAFSPGTSGSCSPVSQVGVASFELNEGGGGTYPVYRIAATTGSPASFGIPIFGIAGIVLNPRLRSDGDYGLTVVTSDINGQPYGLRRSSLTFWGVPADPSHDPERWLGGGDGDWGAGSGLAPRPFLSNPGYCDSGPLDTTISLDSWQAPGQWLPVNPLDPAYRSSAPAPGGCGSLRFGGLAAPAGLSFQPAVRRADTPSGYDARLTLPYNENPGTLANPTLRDSVVKLPPGVVIDPAAASGLGACSPRQIGFLGSGFPLPAPLHFDERPVSCPDSAKIGTVEVRTPLLDHPLTGAVYLAEQGDNPFGSLLAIYLAIEDPATGIVVKLAGRVVADPADGDLTARFEDNPELPFTELALHFFGGPQAPLVNPQVCGAKTTATELTAWSAPYTPAIVVSDSFTIDGGANGSTCLASVAAAPNAPSFEAGTVTPIAGAYSPFVLQISREDGSQRLRGLNLTLPPGLSGKLAGVPFCSEAAIRRAESMTRPGDGARELASPSCPPGSRLGRVSVAAGAGPGPVHVPGTVYLAGPYKGAPLSLVTVVPALAGPFDLGVVTVRAALEVDPASAQIRVLSDPLPQILEGIPLDLRQLRINLDRSDFSLNPTSCARMSLAGGLLGTDSVAALSSPFQVGACRALGFEPRLRLSLKGGTARDDNPALTATLTQTAGQSNIARVSVALPHSEFLDQAHIGTICTRIQFAAEVCPPASIYGHARAITPLLDQPLEGPVYLRSSSHPLPDLVAALHGQVDIVLDGRIDAVRGGIRTTFSTVPDVPVSKFVLRMRGGKRGLLVNSTSICNATKRATVQARGQNGVAHDFAPLLQAQCSKRD
ncbi:MAG: hypothetical protein H0X42_09515 [Solirubrobacterales bacterium]|nr:hypothetical protein [Solirubrobacterales bacterium]